MKKYRLFISFIVVGGITFSGVLLSGIWKDKNNINAVELVGNTTISKKEIFDFAKLSDSLLMEGSLNLQMIEERISKHPNVSSVNAKRNGSKLIIEISEKSPFAFVMPAKDKPLLLIDDKLNLYTFKKEMKDLNLPVISGMSANMEIANIPGEDYNKLKIAHFIITELMKTDRVLYNYVSEIHFSDSVSVTLYTFEGAIPVYLIKNDSFGSESQNLSFIQFFNPANEVLRSMIHSKIIYFYNFIRQVMLYKSRESIESIDLCYKDMVVIKSKQEHPTK